MKSARLLSYVLAAAGFGILLSGPAFSATSRYVELDLEQCEIVDRDEQVGSVRWRCSGPNGYPIHVGEGDLRYFLGYGPNASNQRVNRQTLRPFNRIHDTLELRYREGAETPYASILRYFTHRGGGEDKPEGQVLVVTKIDGPRACHVAYVDALANPNANRLARQAADEAEDFNCESDEPEIVGKSGKSPM